MVTAIRYIKNNAVRLFLVIILIAFWFVDYKSNDKFTFCLFRMITHKNCFACGTIRGISAILHLDFISAYTLNRLNILSLPILGFVYLNCLKNNRL